MAVGENFLKSLSPREVTYDFEAEEITLNLDDVIEGYSQDPNFLFFRDSHKIKIYDRICDHAGGKLSIRGTAATCPLHGWELDISSGFYNNVNCKKEPLLTINTEELESPTISVSKDQISKLTLLKIEDSRRPREERMMRKFKNIIILEDVVTQKDRQIASEAGLNIYTFEEIVFRGR